MKIDHENRIAGLTYFQSGKNLNMMQVVFLDANIPTIVSEYLSSVEGKLRKEFVNSSNTHSHATVFTMKDFNLLTPEWKRRIAQDYQNCVVFVKLVGVVALSREDDVFLGLKIEIHEYNELRLKAGLSEIETPHISTTHICGGGFTRGVSSQSLEEKIILRKRSLEKVQRNITEQSLGEQKGGGEDQVGESPL